MLTARLRLWQDYRIAVEHGAAADFADLSGRVYRPAAGAFGTNTGSRRTPVDRKSRQPSIKEEVRPRLLLDRRLLVFVVLANQPVRQAQPER